MPLTERLQILIESLGGSAVIGDFERIGRSGEANFGRAAKAGERAASDLRLAQERMAQAALAGQAKVAQATQRLEVAQLRAAQSASAVERAQARVAATAPGTSAAAAASTKLELAQLRAAHAAAAVDVAQTRVATTTAAAASAQARHAAAVAAAEQNVAKLGAASAATGASVGALGAKARAGGDAMRLGLATGAVIGAGSLLRLGQASVQAASDLAESASKARQVFGSATGEVEKFGRSSAHNFGLSKQEALEATATFGNLFRGMRLGRDESADLSVEIVKLASDLASFNNLDIRDVLRDLRSGLVGEAEPMRKYGVLLNETAVKSEAARLGIASTSGALSEQQKVQARYSLILKQTTIAQGDFARTSGGLANQQRILSAELENLSAEFGATLIPITVKAVQALNALARATDAVGLPIPELLLFTAAGVATVKGVEALTLALAQQSVAAGAAAAANATAAASATALGAASAGAAGSVAAGSKLGLFAAAGRVLPAIGAVLGGKAAADALNLPEIYRRELLPGLIELERRIPLVGNALAGLDERHHKLGASARDSAEAIEEAKAEQRQQAEAAAEAAANLEAAAAKGWLNTAATKALADANRDGIQAFEGLSSAAGEADSKLDTLTAEAARLSDAMDKAFGGVGTAAQVTERFGEAADKAYQRAVDAATAYAEAQQRVADEVAQATERAAERVQAATERVTEAEERAAERRLAASERVTDAERRLADVKERQSASATTGSNPVRERLIARRHELRDAQEAVDKARKEQADAETQAAKDITRAREDLAASERDLQAASAVTAAHRRDLERAERTLHEARREAASDLAAAIQDHIKGLLATGASMDDIRGAFDRHIDDFRRVTAQMGLNEEATEKLIAKYGLVPETIETVARLAGVNEAIAEAERAANEIAARFRVAQEKAKIVVELLGAEDAVKRLEALRSDTGNILSGYTVTVAPRSGNSIASGLLPGRAAGGLVPVAFAGAGLKVNTPTAIAGEGNPAWPEYVIATDPAHRTRNTHLLMSAAKDMRLLAAGGRMDHRLVAFAGGGDLDMTRLEAVLTRAVRRVAAEIGAPNISVVANGLRDDAMPHTIAREIRRELYLSGR